MSKFHSGILSSVIEGALASRSGRVHFIGVGGVGVYPLFMLLSEMGYAVSGSDSSRGELVMRLVESGKRAYVGSDPEAVRGAALVVYSLAVREDDPEILAAEELGIPTVSRAELFGVIMRDYRVRIGISGSHGKSTVTAMLDAILLSSGWDHTTVIGASLSGTGSPYRAGGREYLVYESCEYKDSFLRFCPTIALFNNLELDHVDYFSDIGAIRNSFLTAMNSSPVSIVNIDDEGLASLRHLAKRRVVTFGERDGADFVGIIEREREGYRLAVVHRGEAVLTAHLPIPGRHNAKNALAAASVALTLGVCPDKICEALSGFTLPERRLQLISASGKNKIYYDYAHHPTEIRASLSALREVENMPILAVFAPHTYSRTRAFKKEFCDALSLADRVLILPVSAIREAALAGVDSESLARGIGKSAAAVTAEEAFNIISSLCGFCTVLMGAGDNLALKEKFSLI